MAAQRIGDKLDDSETMLGKVKDLLAMQANLWKCPRWDALDDWWSDITDVFNELRGIPIDVMQRLADAEQQVVKMRHALNLVKCGMECMIREQREPLQKAIDEVLE